MAQSDDVAPVLIVPEPPPDVTTAQIIDALPEKTVVTTQLHPIGRTGWVKDVVAQLPAHTDTASVISRVSRVVFGTSYKAGALRLPLSVAHLTKDSLDLQVTTADLREWLIDKPSKFRTLLGVSATLGNILAAPDCSVYMSAEHGLAVWWIPRKATVARCGVSFRKFAIDSDLVVGGLSSPTGLLVIGRERQQPLEALPPLRFETVRMLAAASGENSLQQSYERQSPLAGRMPDGHDWAPIYLSADLVDTEYGSLLNITDQLLKGWTNASQTRYENFPYPTPAAFPFGEEPLPKQLGAKVLTYNWNTAGAGYILPVGSRTLYALNRTGALPVSYLPGDEAEMQGTGGKTLPGDAHSQAWTAARIAEDKAYAWYAGLSDPNLVRVVQYAALYQMFHAFKPVAAGPARVPAPERALVKGVVSLLKHLKIEKPATLEKMAERLANTKGAGLEDQAEDIAFGLRALQEILQKLDDAGIQTLAEAVAAPRALQRNAQNLMSQVRRADDAQLAALARARAKAFAISTPHTTPKDLKDLEVALTEKLRDLREGMLTGKDEHELGALAFVVANGELLGDAKAASGVVGSLLRLAAIGDDFWPSYVRSQVSKTPARWLRTPVVVISTNVGTLKQAVGGHDIDARTVRFQTSESLARNSFAVSSGPEGPVVTVSAADAPRISGLAREVGRAGDGIEAIKATLARILIKAPEAPPRSIAVALHLPKTAPPERGLGLDSVTVQAGGYYPRTDIEPVNIPGLLELRKARPNAVGLERMPDGSVHLALPGDLTITAFTMDAAIDALMDAIPGSGRIELVHAGLTADDIERLLVTCELRNTHGRILLQDGASLMDVAFQGTAVTGPADVVVEVDVEKDAVARRATLKTQLLAGAQKVAVTITIAVERAMRGLGEFGHQAFQTVLARLLPRNLTWAQFPSELDAELRAEMAHLAKERNAKLSLVATQVRREASEQLVAEIKGERHTPSVR